MPAPNGTAAHALLDSLRTIIARQDSLLDAAATRTVHVNTAAPSVSVNVPPDAWWNTPLLGGALAAVVGIGATYVAGLVHRRLFEKPRMVQAVGTELSILLARMVGAAMMIGRRRQRLSVEMFDRLLAAVEGAPKTGDLQRMQRGLRHFRGLSPAALTAWQAPQPGPEPGLGLKRYEVPYLQSGLVHIDLLGESTQALLLEVHGALDIFNQQVEDVMRSFWLTFETLTPQNHGAVEENIVRMQVHVLDSALNVADRVALVLRQPEFRGIRPIAVQIEVLPEGMEAA